MPYLKINACIDCPHSSTSSRDKEHNYLPEDMFFIICDHEEQVDQKGFVAKMKNMHNRIYFSCPLDNNN